MRLAANKLLLFMMCMGLTILAFSGLSDASCRVVMKNGYEFTAQSCRKVGDRIEVQVDAGMMILTSDEVLSVKPIKGRQDVKVKNEPYEQINGNTQPGQQNPAHTSRSSAASDSSSSDQDALRKTLQWQLDDLKSRILPLEAEKQAAETERQAILKRMQELKQEGQQKAITNLQDPLVKWMDYLLPADRLWLTEAPQKLAELEAKIASLESTLKPLHDDERYLEQRIHELQ
jgi:hypothetical protein